MVTTFVIVIYTGNVRIFTGPALTIEPIIHCQKLCLGKSVSIVRVMSERIVYLDIFLLIVILRWIFLVILFHIFVPACATLMPMAYPVVRLREFLDRLYDFASETYEHNIIIRHEPL